MAWVAQHEAQKGSKKYVQGLSLPCKSFSNLHQSRTNHENASLIYRKLYILGQSALSNSLALVYFTDYLRRLPDTRYSRISSKYIRKCPVLLVMDEYPNRKYPNLEILDPFRSDLNFEYKSTEYFMA